MPRPLDLRIPLQKLEVLVAVVEEGGFGRAADRLFVAQPVVSAHIRSLEERLDTKLFYRESRRVVLTESGEAVYRWANDILVRTKELERLLAGLNEGRQGAIALGASMTIGSYRLTSLLSEFRREHEHVELKLGIGDTQHVIQDARDGVYDFAVVVFTAGLQIPDMHVEQIGSEDLVLVAAPELVPTGPPLTCAGLGTLPFIDTPARFLDSQLHAHGIEQRNIVLELGHPEAVKRAAGDGVGFAFIFRGAVEDELKRGTLCEIPLTDARFSYPVYIVHRKERSFAPSHIELIEQIRLSLMTPAPPPADS